MGAAFRFWADHSRSRSRHCQYGECSAVGKGSNLQEICCGSAVPRVFRQLFERELFRLRCTADTYEVGFVCLKVRSHKPSDSYPLSEPTQDSPSSNRAA